jgi:hypothetical protein
MNRTFILIVGLLSALLVLSGITAVGFRSIERVRTRHEAQFRGGLVLELNLVTKALRVVRGSLAELAEGGIFSGFSVRREGLVVLDSNVPDDFSSTFVTTVPVAFGDVQEGKEAPLALPPYTTARCNTTKPEVRGIGGRIFFGKTRSTSRINGGIGGRRLNSCAISPA